MKIHQIRNATIVIESGSNYILVDPMLGGKGSLPPFSVFKYKAKRNPIVDLPNNASKILSKVTHVLITHTHTYGLKALQHTDHLDLAGEKFIKKRNLPVFVGHHDEKYMKKQNYSILGSVKYWEQVSFLEGKITAVPALHGHGWNNKLMANGSGFFIQLPNEPSLYISGDTVLTEDVKKALVELNPDIAIVACGSASIDVGPPILMSKNEIQEFISIAPKKVICNHLEALNHCPTKREDIKTIISEDKLNIDVFVPDDGEYLEF